MFLFRPRVLHIAFQPQLMVTLRGMNHHYASFGDLGVGSTVKAWGKRDGRRGVVFEQQSPASQKASLASAWSSGIRPEMGRKNRPKASSGSIKRHIVLDLQAGGRRFKSD